MVSKEQKEHIIAQLIPYNPTQIGVFGSYSRGEEATDSDLDILVSFKKHPNYFQLIEMEDSLNSILGLKIDLVTKKALHPKLRPFIEKDLCIIYDE